jgi:hypothetical protein
MNSSDAEQPPKGGRQADGEEPPATEPSQAAVAAAWAARVAARLREDAEDALAEAKALRRREGAPLRKGLLYGLAGAMNAGERIAAAARGAAAGARAAAQRHDSEGEDQSRPDGARDEKSSLAPGPDAPDGRSAGDEGSSAP